jgi:hypothetical protein
MFTQANDLGKQSRDNFHFFDVTEIWQIQFLVGLSPFSQFFYS